MSDGPLRKFSRHPNMSDMAVKMLNTINITD